MEHSTTGFEHAPESELLHKIAKLECELARSEAENVELRARLREMLARQAVNDQRYGYAA